jgi:hypothetical protein
MGRWRTLAESIRQSDDTGDLRDNRDVSSNSGPIVPNVPIVPANPERQLRQWMVSMARLDPYQPPDGWEIRRWQQLYDDAEWLLAKFGDQAARDGWSSADLFGLWPGKPHWGGIADRLRDSRSLVLTADRAHWRSWGQVERFNRGSYPELVLLWEA